MSLNKVSVYLPAAAIIFGWWLFVFYPLQTDKIPLPNLPPKITEPHISSWNRADLRDALLGDTSKIKSFLELWSEEQNLLAESGFTVSPGLTNEERELAIQLCSAPEETSSQDNYFPQTFNAASYLLAILPGANICSIPEGLKHHPDLYPPSICHSIPFESNRYRAEKLSLANPRAAFVSSYSDPFTIEMLQRQGIETIALDGENSLEAITQSIQCVGQTCKRNEKATLLALFIKAAMNVLDNRARWILSQREGPAAIIYHQMTIQVPTTKSLTGHLLQRLGFDVPTSPIGWRLPLAEEKLLSEQPATLIVITDDPPASHNQLMLSSAIRELNAVKQQRLCYISNQMQHQSNQFIVFAYLDLVEALRN